MGGDGGRRVGFVSRSGVSWPYRRTDIERKGNKTKKKKKKKSKEELDYVPAKLEAYKDLRRRR
jgi:hypothetical protein